MRRRSVIVAAICIPLLATLAGGCAGVIGVQPWEHDVLAKPEMQFDHDVTLQRIHDHVYFSKEASSGGRGFGGGGCGCN